MSCLPATRHSPLVSRLFRLIIIPFPLVLSDDLHQFFSPENCFFMKNRNIQLLITVISLIVTIVTLPRGCSSTLFTQSDVLPQKEVPFA